MLTPGKKRAPRTDRWRTAVCAVLLVFVVIQHITVLASVPSFYQRVTHGQVPTIVAAGREQTSNGLFAARAAARGLSVSAYAAYYLVLNFGIALGFWAAAGLVLWKAGNDWFRWLTALVLTFFPGGALYQITLVTQISYAYLGFGAVLWPMYALFLYLFPNGRAVPHWSRWPMTGYALLHFTLQLAAALAALPGLDAPWLERLAHELNQLGGIIVLVFPFVLGCQIYRYRRVAGTVERKQIQWFVTGLMIYVAALVIILVSARGSNLASDIGYAGDAVNALSLVIPAAITISILRYRLWDIDLIIRRTLVYSALSAVLALAYFGSVLVLQNVFQAVTGEGRSALVTVLSTLIIAALFGPLRGRVQRTIDRRFFRQKYDAARTLAAFGAQARDVVELEQLSDQLLAAVDQTMQPAHVGLWVRKPDGR